ncbi:putative reverse transcriptase zinc-binding domain-containing protein [Helianthus annuus]|nr:putative reverse transcriptase zinc-binding domain-containing protein [Helianthus annuus]
MGGLGLRKLDSINKALILKWAWRFKTEEGSLWVKVISSLHSHRNSFGFLPCKTSLGGAWCNIVKTAELPFVGTDRFDSLIKGDVGDGADIRFWLDPWLRNEPLKVSFPNLFRLELDKCCKVKERVVVPESNPSDSWKWRSVPNNTVELAEWDSLCGLLEEVSLADKRDKWVWLGESDGEFSVGSIKRLMDSNFDFSSRFVWEWSSWIPLKCNLFAWRAELNRIPTRVELSKRNIMVQDSSCPLCLSADETVDHLFTACSFITALWSKVSSWCKTPFLVAFSFRDIVEAHLSCGLAGKSKVAYHGVVLLLCWRVWKARNEVVFSGKPPNVEDVFSDIRSLGYLWFKYRSKHRECSWSDWCKFVIM